MKMIPYSSLASSTSSSYLAPTQANFPCLKHFFPCNEPSKTGGCSITDSVGNVILSHATANLTNNNATDGTISFTQSLTTITGTWAPVAAGNKVVVLLLGKPTAASSTFTMGSVAANTNFGIKTISGSTPQTSANDASVRSGTTTGAGNSTIRAVCSYFDYGSATGIGSLTFGGSQGTSAITTINAITDISAAAFTGGFQPEAIVTVGSTLNPALIAVMHFSTLPSVTELSEMTMWMYANSMVNSGHGKAMYPAFRDRT